jgi:hypothetical protein
MEKISSGAGAGQRDAAHGRGRARPRSQLPDLGAASTPLAAGLMILDVIGDVLADRRQLKQFLLDDRIVALLGKLPIPGRLIPEIVRPIH